MRYYNNGTIQTTSITLSEIRARCFIKEIQNATGLQERITIYQNFHLITDSSQGLLQYVREQQDKQKYETNEPNTWRDDHTLNTHDRTTKYFRVDIVNHCLGGFSFQATGKFHKLYGDFTGKGLNFFLTAGPRVVQMYDSLSITGPTPFL